ncbi:hypothetical protein Drorol1_Dr00010952 [Drosera rotundifolia]
MHYSSSSVLIVVFWCLFIFHNAEGSKLPEGVTVPAIFVFGDSIVDSGNNNYIITACRSNFVPYGRNFEGCKPTGRFTNGKVPSDLFGLFRSKYKIKNELGIRFLAASGLFLLTSSQDRNLKFLLTASASDVRSGHFTIDLHHDGSLGGNRGWKRYTLMETFAILSTVMQMSCH